MSSWAHGTASPDAGLWQRAPDDLRPVRESLTALGFHTDLGPAGGDIFLFPDGTPMHGMHALGESPEVAAVRETSCRGAGVARPVRHHVLPQEHRAWFEERGFVGKRDIDNFTIELEEAMHQAVHGGGDWAARGRGNGTGA